MALFTAIPTIAAATTNSETSTNHPPNTHQCERLPTSLTYTQLTAPADVSAILRVVVEKINRDVTDVVDVTWCRAASKGGGADRALYHHQAGGQFEY